MAVRTRKPIQDKLITDFGLLKHVNGTDALFSEVKKFYLDFPTSLPCCQIVTSNPSVMTQGLDFDSRILTFTSIVYELIEVESDYTEIERKLDRLSDIEDQIFNYLQTIPNPIEHSVSGIHIYKLEVLPSNYSYEVVENGLRVYQTIDFNCYINMNVKNI